MRSRASLLRGAAALALALGFAQLSATHARAEDVLTQHYNNARTGAALDETVLNTANVGSGQFG